MCQRIGYKKIDSHGDDGEVKYYSSKVDYKKTSLEYLLKINKLIVKIMTLKDYSLLPDYMDLNERVSQRAKEGLAEMTDTFTKMNSISNQPLTK